MCATVFTGHGGSHGNGHDGRAAGAPASTLPSCNAGGPPRVVIVGGGFAGLYAATRLNGEAVDVVLVDRLNYHLFQPLLYQVATAGLSPRDIAQPIRHLVSESENIAVLMATVTGVDTRGRRIVSDGGDIMYDYLILAAGARHSYFGHDDWERLAPGLKDLDDAIEIRRRVLTAFEAAEREPDPARRRALLTFVIVGGGPTGIELAGALVELARDALVHDFRCMNPADARIVLLERGPRLLAGFQPAVSEWTMRRLTALGVEVLTETGVTDLSSGLVEAGPMRIETHNVLWAAGVKASPLGSALGVPTDPAGRVRVASDLSVPGHPEIFAVGDLALFTGPTGAPLPGLAPVAIQMGRHAADNVLRLAAGSATREFRYRDRGMMATIGRNAGVAQIGRVKFDGLLAWLAWLFIHIVYLIGFRNRLLVLIEWAWAYVTFNRGVRLITGTSVHQAEAVQSGVRAAPEQDAVASGRRR
jgi:NADH:ubiquinone reductase (H+-translocating)